MPYIASTLTNSQDINLYGGITGTDVVKTIHINGGHGLVNRHLETLDGVITNISDEDLALLLKNDQVKYWITKGFIKITDQTDPAKAVSDMQSRDEAAPMTQNDVDALIDEQVNSKTPNIDIELTFDDGQAPKKRKK